jgi:hypothetical protein
MPLGTAEGRAARWRTRAEQARRDLAEIEALPVTEAARLVRDRAARVHAERAAAARAKAARDARAAKLGQFRGRTSTSVPGRITASARAYDDSTDVAGQRGSVGFNTRNREAKHPGVTSAIRLALLRPRPALPSRVLERC